ncbi:hypothetical protein D3C80_625500 [compost metagenome]
MGSHRCYLASRYRSAGGVCQILCTVEAGIPNLTDVSFRVSPSALQSRTALILSAEEAGLRFLLRKLEGTRAEMSLAVTAYNLKRAISVLGAKKVLKLMG